jgi:hypothetical protein
LQVRGNDCKAADAVADCPADLLHKLLKAERPSQYWAADFTYVANWPIHEAEEPDLAGLVFLWESELRIFTVRNPSWKGKFVLLADVRSSDRFCRLLDKYKNVKAQNLLIFM